MRGFIALYLSETEQQQLASLQSRLSKALEFAGCFPAWVPPQNLHLTLKFLGADIDASDAHCEALGQAIATALRAARDQGGLQVPLSLELGGLMCLPHIKAPRTLTVGLTARHLKPLQFLVDRIDDQLGVLRYARETRPLTPHLTLARFKAMRGTHALPQVMASHHKFVHGMLNFTKISLMESRLDGPTPVYRERLSVPLEG